MYNQQCNKLNKLVTVLLLLSLHILIQNNIFYTNRRITIFTFTHILRATFAIFFSCVWLSLVFRHNMTIFYCVIVLKFSEI